MLLRRDERGLLAIGQPSHAWISGQLARAWGSSRFGAVEPYEQVCLAAEQHDIGMSAWDLEPARNPQTGAPYSFIEMPLAVHVRLWREGPRRLVRQSRYAALLASIHGYRLYRRRDLNELAPDEADAVREFLAGQQSFQHELLVSLQADPASAAAAGPEIVARNSQLLWTWDYMSLALCLDWLPTVAREVPTSNGPVELALGASREARRVSVDPWPFTAATVTVRCEGQRLSERFDTDGALRRALSVAPWETLAFELVPPGAE